jgi:hypothetical protein
MRMRILGMTGRYSNQLNYRTNYIFIIKNNRINLYSNYQSNGDKTHGFFAFSKKTLVL